MASGISVVITGEEQILSQDKILGKKYDWALKSQMFLFGLINSGQVADSYAESCKNEATPLDGLGEGEAGDGGERRESSQKNKSIIPRRE